MYFLKYYVEFSINYKSLVKDNLKYNVKGYIWEIYKKNIAHELYTIPKK